MVPPAIRSKCETPVAMPPKSLTVPRIESTEDKGSSSLNVETLNPPDQGRDLPATLPVKVPDADLTPETAILKLTAEIVPLEDDAESPIMTVRSVLIGVVLSSFGAAIAQLFFFKPVHMQVKLMFLQIASVLIGRSCALLPGPRWWNPGPFSLKEAGFAALMATTAGAGGATITAELVVAYELYFNQVISFGVAFGILLSSQLLGFGWAGLLQPSLVYPSRAVYPEVLPSVSLVTSLFKVGSESEDQVRFLKKALLAAGIYEIFPTFISPAFQAISVFCLTLPKNPLVTIIFGGARPFEGMGIFSISTDWSMIGYNGPLYSPLSTHIHQLCAFVLSIFLFFLAYSKSWFGAGLSQNFPFMSASLLTASGKPYPYLQAINADGTVNEDFIQWTGLPFFTATNYLVQVFVSISLTSSISYAALHNCHIFGSLFTKSKNSEKVDPHRKACMKYKDFPPWGFALVVLVAVALAFGMSASINNSGISYVGLLVAVVTSFLVTLAAGFIVATTGFLIRMSTGIQIVGGLLFPGNVFGNMWFTSYGGASYLQGISMLKDLKYGQYLHISQNLVVYSQLIGCIVGSLTSLLVAKSILKNEREVLLSPSGNGVFSGAALAQFQAHSVSWGIFSRRLFLPGQKYSAVSWGLVIGILLPIPFFVAHKYLPRSKLQSFNVPLFFGIIPNSYTSAYAGETMHIIIGFTSQLWARKYRTQWFIKYNYILSASLDGATEIVVFFIAMVFQGGGGHRISFPSYFLNPPPSTPRDYCQMNTEGRGSE